MEKHYLQVFALQLLKPGFNSMPNCRNINSEQAGIRTYDLRLKGYDLIVDSG